MSVTITSLELENVKRIKAVSVTPSATGLTIIGGKNNQGKTSVLDAIAWALGGDRYRPSQPLREGGEGLTPNLKVSLSNGIIVERKGKNSDLKVTDPSGRKAGQQLLNSFLSVLALDLPKFMDASDKEKADTLLKIIGVGDQLAVMDARENTLYYERRAIGQQADQKAKYAEGLPFVEGVPETEVSASELIQRQQSILLQNAENEKKRQRLSHLVAERDSLQQQIDLLIDQLRNVTEDVAIAQTAAQDLVDQSTAALEEDIRRVDQINQAVRANAEKTRASKEAQALSDQYKALTADIEQIRTQRQSLLASADLPLPGLSVEKGVLLYHGKAWDCMSGSDQLRVAVAIVRRLNPACGFVLLDKLEQMDKDTLTDFGEWLEQEGLQAIATRVSTGEECSIIIEDGFSKPNAEPPQPQMQWTPGYF